MKKKKDVRQTHIQHVKISKKVKNKIILIFSFLVFVAVVIGITLYLLHYNKYNVGKNAKRIDDDTIQNTSKEVSKDQVIEGVLFYDVKFINQNGKIYLTANIKNTSDHTIEAFNVRLNFWKNETNELGESYPSIIMAYILSLKPGEESAISSEADDFDSIINSDKMTIEKVEDVQM